jgi:hypothetical protein
MTPVPPARGKLYRYFHDHADIQLWRSAWRVQPGRIASRERMLRTGRCATGRIFSEGQSTSAEPSGVGGVVCDAGTVLALSNTRQD